MYINMYIHTFVYEDTCSIEIMSKGYIRRKEILHVVLNKQDILYSHWFIINHLLVQYFLR